jgi:hypothetical protein
MARYDDGFGGPRGGWRGRQGGPYNRGFPEPGGIPEEWQGGRPDHGPYRGGEWSRAYGGGSYGSGGAPSGGWGGGERGYNAGGHTFGSGNRTGHGFGGGNRSGIGWGGSGNRSGVGWTGSGSRSDGPGLGSGHRAGGFGVGSGNRSGGYSGGRGGPYGGETTGSGGPGGWTYHAHMDRGAGDPWRGGRGGWDRGQYGGAYEEDSGYPGAPMRGDYYGAGRTSQERGYDAGYAREPFMPEEAYRRHPEYRQAPHRREWEAHQHDFGDDELGDDEIREAVYARMHADAWLEPERIDVQVEDGVVTLTGEVDDFLKARYAWDDAWEADGVRGVVNNLTVRADEPRDEPHGDIVAQSGGDRSSPEELGSA